MMSCKAIMATATLLLGVILSSKSFVEAGDGEPYDIRENYPQKSYDEDEEGKLLPTKTFLNTLEITLLCIFFVVAICCVVFCLLYVYCFGCILPGCCKQCWKRRPCRGRKNDEEYTQVELHRERKIGEIWKTNYPKNGAGKNGGAKNGGQRV